MTTNRTTILALLLSATLPAAALAAEQARKPIPLKEVKLIIEHNATALDTGFQGAIDSEGWQELTVTGPAGAVLKFSAEGKLQKLGLTELFFETVEPENADVPIRRMLANLPEGDYTFAGPVAGPGGGTTSGKAHFTHTIPAGTTLLSPPENATVPVADLTMKWTPVTRTIDGKPVRIIAYQLIVEKIADPHPRMIGKPNSLSMYLSPSVTRMIVPKAFLEAGTQYDWEVLAIETGGNQTLKSGKFSTQ